MTHAALPPSLDELLPHLPDAALLLTRDGHCVRASRAALALFGGPIEGRSVRDFLPADAAAALLGWADASTEGAVLPVTVERRAIVHELHLIPADAHLLVLLRPTTLSAGVAQLRDVLASGVADSEALHESLLRFCLWVERHEPGAICTVLIYDEAHHCLRDGAAPSLPPQLRAEFDGLFVGDGQGSCGTAVHRRAPVIVEDILTDPLWAPARHAAHDHGLRSCWSQPIFAEDGRVLGTFAVYRRVPGGPSPRERAFIDDAAKLGALILERALQRRALAAASDHLRESEARYRMIVEESADLICLMDQPDTVVYVSSSVTALLGWTPGQLIGTGFLSITHPEDTGLARARAEARFAGTPTTESIIVRMQCADGGWRHLDSRARLLPPMPGSPPRMLISMRDLTQRLEQEQALRESERRLRQLFDNLTGFLFLLDVEGRIVEVSAAAARAGGFEKGTVAGLCIWTIGSLGTIPETTAALRGAVAAAARGESCDGEVIFGPEGHERLARFHASPLTDEDGRVRFILGEAVDITEQRRAERALAESEKLFKQISEQSPSLVTLLDVEQRTFVYLSRAVEKMLGRPPSFFVDRVPGELLTLLEPADAPKLERWYRCVQEALDGETIENELRWRHADGSTKTHVSRSVVFTRTASGAPKLVLSLANDVSEQRALESRLRQTDKMEALGTLAGGVAHDFNNLLAVIMNYGEMLRADVAPASPMAEDVGQILAASRRARDLVRQILAFSRKSDLTRETFDLRDVVQETLRFLRASLPATVDLSAALPAEPMRVQGDANQLQQVIINLGVNAEYALRGRSGGRLEMALDTVVLESGAALAAGVPAGRHHRLRITDNGQGMPPHVLQRIFEPFFTTKPVGEGTGMGLAAAHGIITQHGGLLRAESEEGVGTSFEVLVPAAAEADGLQPRDAGELTVPSGRGRILLVDDEPAIARVMSKVLTRFGFETTSTDDPVAALALFRAQPEQFDCLITDFTMPQLTGDQLAREVLALRPGFPIVLCSGFSPDITPAYLEAVGIAAFLNKPIEPSELVATITRIIAAATR